MSPLGVPWWVFWLLASVALYTSLMVLFVREATRFGQDMTGSASEGDDDPVAPASHEPPGREPGS